MARAFVDFDSGGAWSWIPADPAKSSEAISFEIEAGKELDVTYKDEPAGARTDGRVSSAALRRATLAGHRVAARHLGRPAEELLLL